MDAGCRIKDRRMDVGTERIKTMKRMDWSEGDGGSWKEGEGREMSNGEYARLSQAYPTGVLP